MPYPNFHSFRTHDPKDYKDFAYKELAPGVSAVIGIPANKTKGSEIQAYRFSTEKFSYEEAKAWMKAHDKKAILEEKGGKK